MASLYAGGILRASLLVCCRGEAGCAVCAADDPSRYLSGDTRGTAPDFRAFELLSTGVLVVLQHDDSTVMRVDGGGGDRALLRKRSLEEESAVNLARIVPFTRPPLVGDPTIIEDPGSIRVGMVYACLSLSSGCCTGKSKRCTYVGRDPFFSMVSIAPTIFRPSHVK